MKRTTAYWKLYAFVMPLVGLLCLGFPEQISRILPYLLGGAMVLTGLIRVVIHIWKKQYLSGQYSHFARGLILLILGIAILVRGADSLGLMGTTWGLLGLSQCAEGIDETLRKKTQGEHYIGSLLETAVKLALSLMLLFDPFEKFAEHVRLLGIEILVMTVRMPWERSKQDMVGQEEQSKHERAERGF